LASLQRFENALEETRHAERLDPDGPKLAEAVAWVLYMAGPHDEAIRQLQQTLARHADFAPAYATLTLVYAAKGMHPEALQAAKKGLALDENPRDLCGLAYVWAKAGRAEEARNVLERVRREAAKNYVDPADLAMVDVALGETDRALGLLEQAYEQRSDRMPDLRVDPVWHGLRQQPRFQALVQKMKFPP
jgi:tetratricopeptide (TPR) repeat protein